MATLEHFTTNNAMIFGIFKPGERSLYNALQDWDESDDTGQSTQLSIENEKDGWN